MSHLALMEFQPSWDGCTRRLADMFALDTPHESLPIRIWHLSLSHICKSWWLICCHSHANNKWSQPHGFQKSQSEASWAKLKCAIPDNHMAKALSDGPPTPPPPNACFAIMFGGPLPPPPPYVYIYIYIYIDIHTCRRPQKQLCFHCPQVPPPTKPCKHTIAN